MTNYDTLLQLLKDEGMDKKWSRMFVKKLSDDEKAFPADDQTKKWAMSRGFFPGRVMLYGLTEENYKDYLPDYNYFMMHPVNHHFRIWVNDKLTLKYVLNSNGCEQTMPKYYLYVENNGDYTYMMDAPADIPKDKDFLFNLMKKEGTIAAKPNSGTSGGRGFMKLEYRDGVIYENNKPITREEFDAFLPQMGNYVVTEYCYQHEDLSKIWPESECTLRVIMVKLPRESCYDASEWKCVISFARFGATTSGGASNLSAGGIGVGFDFATGKFNDTGLRYRRFCESGDWVVTEHPDTHVQWKGFCLPHWEQVRDTIDRVCKHIDSLDYLGLDIIITPEGFKFCEINTHPAADYAQVMCGPILADEKARGFYEAHGLRKFNSERFYEMYLQSQE